MTQEELAQALEREEARHLRERRKRDLADVIRRAVILLWYVGLPVVFMLARTGRQPWLDLLGDLWIVILPVSFILFWIVVPAMAIIRFIMLFYQWMRDALPEAGADEGRTDRVVLGGIHGQGGRGEAVAGARGGREAVSGPPSLA